MVQILLPPLSKKPKIKFLGFFFISLFILAFSIIQMPPGIPVATVGVNGAKNAAILAVEILALNDVALATKYAKFKASLKEKIVKANQELKKVNFPN